LFISKQRTVIISVKNQVGALVLKTTNSRPHQLIIIAVKHPDDGGTLDYL